MGFCGRGVGLKYCTAPRLGCRTPGSAPWRCRRVRRRHLQKTVGWAQGRPGSTPAFFAPPVCSSKDGVPRPVAAKQRRTARHMIPVPERQRGVQGLGVLSTFSIPSTWRGTSSGQFRRKKDCTAECFVSQLLDSRSLSCFKARSYSFCVVSPARSFDRISLRSRRKSSCV